MHVEIIPTLVQQFRETMEGDVGSSWITDGKADSGVLGFIENIPPEIAFHAPVPGHRSLAEHVKHLHFALALTHLRMQGQDPRADWGSSFDLSDRTPAGWEQLKRELRNVYNDVMIVVNNQAKIPLADWPPIYVVGLATMTAHNAYHLGAIRQIAIAARSTGNPKFEIRSSQE
jgi:hypothetical protein